MDKKEPFEGYVNIQKNLMNEKRLGILMMLNKQNSTWSGLMNELNIRNPKLLLDHISMLTSSNLIKKNDNGFYSITNLGKTFLEANLSIMKELLRKGVKID